jgi:putative oxidoreductase
MSETAQSRPGLFFPFMASFYDRASGLAYPLIRLFTGLILMPHGAQKLFGWFGGGGLEATAQGFAERLGLEPGMFFAVLAGGTEFFGGLCLAIGLFTRVAAAGVVILMTVAIFAVHLGNGFFVFEGGYEYALLWGIVALAIFFRGGGELSLDRRIGREF